MPINPSNWAKGKVSLGGTVTVMLVPVVFWVMARARIERRLKDVGKQLSSLRTDLAVAEQALLQVDYEADDARLRALVSETPVAQKEHEQARRQVDVIRRNRDELRDEVLKLEARQDELLDAYNGA